MKSKDINLDNYDLNLIKYIARYKLIKTSDIKYIYNQKYPQRRIKKLMDNHYISAKSGYVSLTKYGREELFNKYGIKAYESSRNKKYLHRLKIISQIAIEFWKNNRDFIPSWVIKDGNYTLWSRKYIGEVAVNLEYIVYILPETNKAIRFALYDINKDYSYKNIIIFVDNFDKVNDIDMFLFPNKENRIILLISQIKKFAHISKINKDNIIYQIYNKNCLEGNYDFVDGKINNRNIIIMPLVNIDIISSINNFYDEYDLITFPENIEVIKRLLNEQVKKHVNFINLGDYINEI